MTKVCRCTFKYALIIVDVAFYYKEAEPLAAKEAAGILERIYKWVKLLQVNPGRKVHRCSIMTAGQTWD